MIGSHNSFTYANPIYKSKTICQNNWKCQSKDIKTQYTKHNIMFFDLHICLSSHNSFTYFKDYKLYSTIYKWSACTGNIELDIQFKDIADILKFMEKNAPNALFRIIFDDTPNISKFKDEIKNYINTEYFDITNCVMIAVSNPWEVLYINIRRHPQKIYNYTLQKHTPMTDIEKWAKQNNPKFKKDEISDNENLYIVDYCEYIAN